MILQRAWPSAVLRMTAGIHGESPDMPKYPWRSYSPLRTHDFEDGILLKGREPRRLFVCRTCLRRFKYDSWARTTWAVGKAQGFPPLENSVNNRWISERCAGGPGREDEEDSKRTVSHVA